MSRTPRVAPFLSKDSAFIMALKKELADHVVEVNLQHDVLDGMFTFYDSTVSTLQIYQVASVTFDLLLLLGLGSYLITLFSLLVITTRVTICCYYSSVRWLPSFIHGIDIVNTADYFSLSSRVNSFLHVAVTIAQYDGYLHSFMDELLSNKIGHWEKGLRELASNALSTLVKYDPEYSANFVLEKLIPCTLATDLCMRHGATLAVGELVLVLNNCGCVLPKDKQKVVAGVVPAIDTLNENLRHPNGQIHNAANQAFKHFVPTYFAKIDDKGSYDITLKYLEQLTDANVAVRRGSALAIGVLPFEFIATRWKMVLEKLCKSCAIKP